MLAPLIPFLAIGVFLGLFAWVLFTKGDKNKLFIKYILLAYPLIATTILPGGAGYNNFDIISILFFLIFYRPRHVHVKGGLLYLVLFILLTAIGITACFLAESITEETFRMFIEYFATFIFAKILIDEIIADPPSFMK